MTENQKQLKIIFTSNTWSLREELKDYKQQHVWDSGSIKDADIITDNKEFKATLTYEGFSRGRSALNIEWLDKERKLIYYSGMSLLDEALTQGFVEGNRISGTFCFKKQGTSILLQQL